MDYDIFFKFGEVKEIRVVRIISPHTIGKLILIPTKKNAFFEEGEVACIHVNEDGSVTVSGENEKRFCQYMGVGTDFCLYCLKLWNKHSTNIENKFKNI